MKKSLFDVWNHENATQELHQEFNYDFNWILEEEEE